MERSKITKHIDIAEGKLLVFGGVYSNLQALEKMEAIAQTLGIPAHRTICTGDVVGYCAQPEEVVQKVKSWGIHSIAGNVEIQLREGEEDCGCDFTDGSRCDSFSKQWYPYAQQKLSASSIKWMEDLPDFIQFEFGRHKMLVVHGSYFHTSEFVFKSTPWLNKTLNFNKSETDVILAGHCGLPFNDSQQDKLWLNPGVIGMPANDGTTRVWYMLIDLDKESNLSFSHEHFTYNHKKAADLMQQKGLTPEYAKTLNTGIWDNCEILPLEETKAQAKPLHFN
jgi:predicted phosphodiesterase